MRALWINEQCSGPREAWRGAFDSACEVREIDASQLSTRAAEGEWDFVCFNFDFPEMTVLKLIPQTKNRWPSAPILMLTMQCSLELALWALRVRVFDVLVKPITSDEITRCLQRIAEAVRARTSQSERRPQASVAPMPAETRYRPQITPSLRLQSALAYISRHLNEPLSESKLAAVCHVSPSRFCREFKSAFGVTYVDYLTRHRIEQAKQLMRNGAISIADVAAAVGFTDPSYFARVFHRLEGTSPSAFRSGPAAIERAPPGAAARLGVESASMLP